MMTDTDLEFLGWMTKYFVCASVIFLGWLFTLDMVKSFKCVVKSIRRNKPREDK